MSCNDFVKKYELANLLALFCFDCRYRAIKTPADSAFSLTMLGDKIRDTSCSNEKRIILLYITQLHAVNSK